MLLEIEQVLLSLLFSSWIWLMGKAGLSGSITGVGNLDYVFYYVRFGLILMFG